MIIVNIVQGVNYCCYVATATAIVLFFFISRHRDLRGGEMQPGKGVQDEDGAAAVRLLTRLLPHHPQARCVRQRRADVQGRVHPAAGPLHGPPGPGGHVPGRVQK